MPSYKVHEFGKTRAEWQEIEPLDAENDEDAYEAAVNLCAVIDSHIKVSDKNGVLIGEFVSAGLGMVFDVDDPNLLENIFDYLDIPIEKGAGAAKRYLKQRS